MMPSQEEICVCQRLFRAALNSIIEKMCFIQKPPRVEKNNVPRYPCLFYNYLEDTKSFVVLIYSGKEERIIIQGPEEPKQTKTGSTSWLYAPFMANLRDILCLKYCQRKLFTKTVLTFLE